MTPRFRQSAELYAELASVRLTSLAERDKKRLVKQTWNELKDEMGDSVKRLSSRDFPLAWKGLQRVHPRICKFITDLVDTGETDAYARRTQEVSTVVKVVVSDARTTYAQIRNTNSTNYAGSIAENYGQLTDALFFLIHGRRFPFSRCPSCKKIFVSTTPKKRYCSKSCANKAIGPRTEYMRKYMAERRANERKIKRD